MGRIVGIAPSTGCDHSVIVSRLLEMMRKTPTMVEAVGSCTACSSEVRVANPSRQAESHFSKREAAE